MQLILINFENCNEDIDANFVFKKNLRLAKQQKLFVCCESTQENEYGG